MKPFSLPSRRPHQNRSDALLTNALGLTEGTQDLQDAPELASVQPGTPDDATAVITRTRDSALAFGKELIHALSADLRQGELSELDAIWELLPYHISVVNVANVALAKRAAAVPVPQTAHSPAVPEYFISSRFLTDCYTYVTADPRGFERLHIVSGLSIDGNRYTLEQMKRVAMSEQSHTGARADQPSLTNALIELSEDGHALHALFHSHPGLGPKATLPSLDKDIPTHQRLEDGGYPLIGAIFVKDGYVRFLVQTDPLPSPSTARVLPLCQEKKMFTKSIPHQYLVTYRTKHLLGVEDRQVKLKDYNQEALTRSTIILIGAGGLGGEIGEALVRKGVGKLILIDFDLVEPSNLNRQKFYKADLYKPKAFALARNLAKEGFLGSTLIGYSLSFQDAVNMGVDMSADVVVCGVDNNPCRIAVSRYFRQRQIPVVFTSVSIDASHGYVFIQQPGKACFACQFPKAVNDESYPCGTPAVKDILKVVGGVVSYAVDTLLLMERLRTWNYKHCYLCGSVPGKDWLVPRRPGCKLCGEAQDQPPDTVWYPASQTEGGRA